MDSVRCLSGSFCGQFHYGPPTARLGMKQFGYLPVGQRGDLCNCCVRELGGSTEEENSE
jgi:hypothetical protein